MRDCKDFTVNGTAISADCGTSNFSENSLWDKLKRFGRIAGSKVVYLVLVLYYALFSRNTPNWAKTVIISALVYFICPVDAIPDTIPIIGFSDDLAALEAAFEAVKVSVTPDVVAKAKAKASEWFGTVEEIELA